MSSMLTPATIVTRPVIVAEREASLTAIHREVLSNFTRNMDLSVDDIDRVVYSISSYRLHIDYINIVLVDGTDYIFAYEHPDASGRPEDVAYTFDLRVRELRANYGCDSDDEDDYGHGILYRNSYRVHLNRLQYLPKPVIKRIGTRELKSDILISLPSTMKSFIKHHKDLVKIDRRRKVPEIYKEWDETIRYYPITVIDYAYPDEPVECTADDYAPVPMPCSVSIGWSDDDW